MSMDADERAAITDALIAITGALIKVGPFLPDTVSGVFHQEVNNALLACGRLIRPRSDQDALTPGLLDTKR